MGGIKFEKACLLLRVTLYQLGCLDKALRRMMNLVNDDTKQ